MSEAGSAEASGPQSLEPLQGLAFIGEQMVGELTAEATFTRIEEDVRRFWRRNGVPEEFHRRAGAAYGVYQQPLRAAGQPLDEQIRLMATADLFARYHAMQGERVYYRSGWSCHGLAVEVAVEKSLGPELAGYDLAQFNAACRSATIAGVQEGEALADRLGLWPDSSDSFVTLAPEATSAVWGALRRLWDVGRLKCERRVVSVCPRCGTPLSTAEAACNALEIEASSVWLRLPWDGEPGSYFLVWTPVPWTLLGMVALAVHPDSRYVLVEVAGEEDAPPSRVLLAEAALSRTQVGDYEIVRRMKGKSLRDARYHPPFTFLPVGEAAGRVVLSEDVSFVEGTGVVPVTPTYDAESLSVAQAHGLPLPELLDDRGGLDDTVMTWRGLSPLDAESLLIEDLDVRGLLFRTESVKGQKALCLYCQTPLLPLARSVWSLETGSGSWLISRDRAWGVPLPVWTCAGCGETLCLAGLDDLAHRTGVQVDQIDPHRPAVDRLVFPCETCGGTMHRVPPLVDAAFEDALLPWAMASRPGPADLAVGLGDRHLGWLGDFAETAALLRGTLGWEQAVALPEGDTWGDGDRERTLPGDVLRWAAYTGVTPEQAEQDFFRPLWRLVSLLRNPSRSAGDMPVSSSHIARETGETDGDDLVGRWLMARLHQVAGAVEEALDAYDAGRAAQVLASLAGDLFEWYLPHRPGRGVGTVKVLGRLLAPFVPHLAEAIHRQLGGQKAQSVHLDVWPTVDLSWEDETLLAQMALVRRLVALGRDARRQAGLQAEHSLRQALVVLGADDEEEAASLAPFYSLLAEAMAVSRVRFTAEAAALVGWRLHLHPERMATRNIEPAELEAALARLAADEVATLVSQLGEGLSVRFNAAGQVLTLLPDEVEIMPEARAGWTAAADVDAGLLVVLEMD